MNREAVDYVKEAESRAAQFRKDGQEEMNKIELQKNDELSSIQEKLEQELATYEQEKRSRVDEKLSTDREEMERSVSLETDQFFGVYQEKKNDVAKLIAKEVLRRYGNSQNEKNDTSGRTV